MLRVSQKVLVQGSKMQVIVKQLTFQFRDPKIHVGDKIAPVVKKVPLILSVSSFKLGAIKVFLFL